MSDDGSCSDSNVSKEGSHLSDLFANGVSLFENDSFYSSWCLQAIQYKNYLRP